MHWYGSGHSIGQNFPDGVKFHHQSLFHLYRIRKLQNTYFECAAMPCVQTLPNIIFTIVLKVLSSLKIQRK